MAYANRIVYTARMGCGTALPPERKIASMPVDIRDKRHIHHADVVSLNFINPSVPFVFRRHFRQGLRSHVIELIKPSDIEVERSGIVKNGSRWFPKAKPHKIFRIFRTRLKTLDNALQEIERVKIVEKYLYPDCLARSNELIVHYMSPQGPDLMLCGLQEYVDGEILDPWSVLDNDSFLENIYADLCSNPDNAVLREKNEWICNARQKGARFIQKVKQMIAETDHVPDLAGVGNIMIVASGAIKLVDINNICLVCFDSQVQLDDRGYPVCDKSIEALSLLEKKILGRKTDDNEMIYKVFLDPERKGNVQRQADIFFKKMRPISG
jgi:hypothetical protein